MPVITYTKVQKADSPWGLSDDLVVAANADSYNPEVKSQEILPAVVQKTVLQ
ncbi:MAG: hypothetical protein ACK526_05495 [Planctomyces sp.]